MGLGQTWSPVIPLVDGEAVAGYARQQGIGLEEAMLSLVDMRERAVADMAEDPLTHGYKPPIWKVCEGLLGAPWMDRALAERIRDHLGFPNPVRSLLILGGNRSSKTRFECTYGMKMLVHMAKSRLWLFHMTHQMSVEYHHALMWDMLPPVWRRKVKQEREYISWNKQRGFSDSKFILANEAEASFRNYSQDIRDAIEGGEPNAAIADELIPGEWVETLEMRLATRSGWMIIGFTPVEGYSGTVRLFCDGATVVKDCTAFLLPKDGGEPDEARALGLEPEEYREVRQALDERRAPQCAPCRPQACLDWLEGGTGEPEAPKGRTFERMPRVMRCADPSKAVVFFYASDNPFGNPAEVVAKVRAKDSAFRRERFYGFAEKLIAARFTMFNERVHVIKADQVPAHGTNYQIVDPCSGRAFFMLWIRATPDGKHFVYREWPGRYYIPGVGVPEEWALPSAGKEMDGKKGKGQRSPGWGLAGYKREMARLEGWMSEGKGEGERGELWKMQTPEGMTEEEWVRSWNQWGPARERVFERYMDARFANTRSFEDGGMVTLLEKFEEMGLTFYDSSTGGGRWTIEDGCALVENALAYDAERPVDFFNQPMLYISEECQNLIFAMKTWTGEDGQTGATKDPIDTLRMYFLKGGRYVDVKAGAGVVAGRGCY